MRSKRVASWEAREEDDVSIEARAGTPASGIGRGGKGGDNRAGLQIEFSTLHKRWRCNLQIVSRYFRQMARGSSVSLGRCMGT